MKSTMNAKQMELWRKIKDFAIDEAGAAFTFGRRLAQENAWTHEFAERVIEEYRRFVFLAMCAGHPVTPSDQVDQAWHLHLTYTRSYWERLCTGVLPRPLHHDPTRGGAAEGEKFNDWYAKTMESYVRFFGAPAPAEIWPDASIRFHDDTHFERVNTLHNWVVPKLRVKRGVRLTAALGVPGLVLAGCTPLLLARSDELGAGAIFVVVAFVIVMLIVVVAAIRRGAGGSSGSGCGSSGCGGGWFGGGCGSSHHSHGSSGGSDSSGSGGSGSGCGSSGCSGGGCGGGGCGGGGD